MQNSISSLESVSPPPHQQPKRSTHAKKVLGKYSRNIDSPAYDASEEDNEVLTDDAASTVSFPAAIPRKDTPKTSSSKPSYQVHRKQHHLAASVVSDSDSVDSPTYDGDVESTIPTPSVSQDVFHHPSSSVSTLNSPGFPSNGATPSVETLDPIMISTQPLLVPEEPAVPSAAENAFNPAKLAPEDIRAFVQKAIDGEEWRKYQIKKPPTDRPVRVYADGVYDLFHFGHALQLRQAKLSFPSVYLLVGVNSDEQVREHKAQGIMTHAERLEGVRHCRWVDEVVADAPWIIDEAFMKKHQIDYVAHDEDPYGAVGHDDVYAYVKSQGKFIPTRRTPGVSTSELLERIVVGYRTLQFDEKLIKMGHEELRAEGSEYDDSRRGSRVPSRAMSPVGSKPFLTVV
ncbi:cholinephosphate cytidylyltransferase [Flagelloscypha sp. PMI_526]|nr:cholinephosphate cytidylyltransferase [Flagelloscypha sp. PMI_526]